MSANLKVLVVGIGDMGSSHAKGYAALEGYQIVGFTVAKNVERAKKLAADLKLDVPVYTDYYKAMAELKPDVVSINTYVDTHAAYSIHAMKQGCHVFMEKPIAKTVKEAEQVQKVFTQTKRKLVIGLILRVHPAWAKFVEVTHTLGKPLIMRMNLNQQSFGKEWALHKRFIAEMPPLVDCGVHYVDQMCVMTRSKPVLVQGMAARVSDEIDADKHNYGALQVVFADKSVGWYEVGWGPMMSKHAYFVKDVIGPKGCVSLEKDLTADPSDVSRHAEVAGMLVHSSEADQTGYAAKKDQFVKFVDEPDHNELCKLEQAYLLKAIREDINLDDFVGDAVNSLKICFAAVESYKTGRAIKL
jgi:predicted dehydrogenase